MALLRGAGRRHHAPQAPSHSTEEAQRPEGWQQKLQRKPKEGAKPPAFGQGPRQQPISRGSNGGPASADAQGGGHTSRGPREAAPAEAQGKAAPAEAKGKAAPAEAKGRHRSGLRVERQRQQLQGNVMLAALRECNASSFKGMQRQQLQGNAMPAASRECNASSSGEVAASSSHSGSQRGGRASSLWAEATAGAQGRRQQQVPKGRGNSRCPRAEATAGV